MDRSEHGRTLSSMGIYDTVSLDGRTGQVKCFGKALRELNAGARVTLHRGHNPRPGRRSITTTTDAEDLFGVGQEVWDYQIAMIDPQGTISYLTVSHGVLRRWVLIRDHAVPVFDNWGEPYDGDPRRCGYAD